mmetsp:Transcript_43424/g.139572  ORF Transcript_43424/g.139572 Transcript_43424/m.139572 type:complete len:482 (-) Transcript_43424:377-1822(-)
MVPAALDVMRYRPPTRVRTAEVDPRESPRKALLLGLQQRCVAAGLVPLPKHHIAEGLLLEEHGIIVLASIRGREDPPEPPRTQRFFVRVNDDLPGRVVERRDSSHWCHVGQRRRHIVLVVLVVLVLVVVVVVVGHVVASMLLRGGGRGDAAGAQRLLQPEQGQAVFNERVLDALVQRRVTAQRGPSVDLEQPGLQLVIDHDVEAEDLEAARGEVLAVVAVRRAGLAHMRLDRDQGLDDEIGDPFEEAVEVQGVPLKVSPQLLQRALRRHAPASGCCRATSTIVRVAHKVLGVLVDGVVGQMHRSSAQSLDIASVLFRGQPHQPFGVEVHLQRVVGRDHDVEAEVEFEALDQKWVPNVLLDDTLLLRKRVPHGHVIGRRGRAQDDDSVTLAPPGRLPNPNRIRRVQIAALPGFPFLGHRERRGRHAIGLAEALVHPGEVPGQEVLLAEVLPRPWKMVHPLRGRQRPQQRKRDLKGPEQRKII